MAAAGRPYVPGGGGGGAVGGTCISTRAAAVIDPSAAGAVGTAANLRRYIDGLVFAKATNCAGPALAAFANGFWDVVPQAYLRVFSGSELGGLLHGQRRISVSDLQAATVLNPPTESAHHRYLWQVLRTFSQADLRRFIRFLTGTETVPASGFRALRWVPNIDVPAEVKAQAATLRAAAVAPNVPIVAVGGVPVPLADAPKFQAQIDRILPSASTCSSTLHLPPYSSARILEERLRFALTEGAVGFGKL